MENEVEDFTGIEGSEGILDVKIGGWFEPVYQEPTWKENGQTMASLMSNLEGQFRCALTGKLTTDDLSENGERSVARKEYCDVRLGVRRFTASSPTTQDKPFQDREGKSKGRGQRLVVREIKKAMKKSDVSSAAELFSGMPPLESVYARESSVQMATLQRMLRS